MSTDEPKENTPRIIVVSAAIVNVQAKRLMLAQRGETTYSWMWYTPGGQVEPALGESELEALVRELKEELGVDYLHYGRLGPMVYEHDIASTRTGKMITVRCYRVHQEQIWNRYQCLDKTVGIRWVTADELETVHLTPADDANRGKLMALLR